jgi:hypothetical protein
MSTVSTPASPASPASTGSARSVSRSRPLVPGATLAIGVAVLFGELYAYGSGSEDNPLRAPLVIAAMSIVTAIPLFRFGVARWGTRAVVVLAVLSFLGIAVYWAGFPAVLGVGAIVLARAVAQESGRWVPATRVAAGVAALALLLQLVASVLG